MKKKLNLPEPIEFMANILENQYRNLLTYEDVLSACCLGYTLALNSFKEKQSIKYNKDQDFIGYAKQKIRFIVVDEIRNIYGIDKSKTKDRKKIKHLSKFDSLNYCNEFYSIDFENKIYCNQLIEQYFTDIELEYFLNGKSFEEIARDKNTYSNSIMNKLNKNLRTLRG